MSEIVARSGAFHHAVDGGRKNNEPVKSLIAAKERKVHERQSVFPFLASFVNLVVLERRESVASAYVSDCPNRSLRFHALHRFHDSTMLLVLCSRRVADELSHLIAHFAAVSVEHVVVVGAGKDGEDPGLS